MRLISTRSRANDVAKYKNNDQMRLLSTRTRTNEVAKHKNKGKSSS